MYQRSGLQRLVRKTGRTAPAARAPARDGSHARPSPGRRAPLGGAAGHAGRGPGALPGRASSKAASCPSCSARPTPRRCACWPPTGASSTARPNRAAAARCRCTPATARRRATWRGATSTRSARSSLDAIIINAAGCGSTLKEYGHLLADDPAYAERARAFARKCQGRLRVPGRDRPGAADAAGADAGDLPGRLSPGPRPGHPPAAAQAAAHDPGPRAGRDEGIRRVLRQRRHLQPDPPRHLDPGPRSRRWTTSLATGATPSSRRIPAARCSWSTAPGGAASTSSCARRRPARPRLRRPAPESELSAGPGATARGSRPSGTRARPAPYSSGARADAHRQQTAPRRACRTVDSSGSSCPASQATGRPMTRLAARMRSADIVTPPHVHALAGAGRSGGSACWPRPARRSSWPAPGRRSSAAVCIRIRLSTTLRPIAPTATSTGERVSCRA